MLAAAAADGLVVFPRSPFQIEVSDPEADLIRPAVQGTEAVLQSAARHKQTVERVIITSSVAGRQASWSALVSTGKPARTHSCCTAVQST